MQARRINPLSFAQTIKKTKEKDMNDTVSLLKECNAGCKSATNSLEQVREYIKDSALKDLVDKYDKRHVALGDECHTLLEEVGAKEKDPSPIPAAMAKLGTDIKLTINDSTSHIANLLADGCHMGVKSLTKYKNQYKNADQEAVHITENLIELEMNMYQDLLAFM